MNRYLKIELPPKPGYGAAEIKQSISANTLKAFLMAMALTACLLLVSVFTGSLNSKETKILHKVPYRVGTTEVLIERETPDDRTTLPPLELLTPPGIKEVMGTLIPSLDPGLDTSIEIAPLGKLDIAGGTPGNGTMPVDDNGGLGLGTEPEQATVIDVPAETIDQPEETESYSVDVPPVVDINTLQAGVTYPEAARRNGVQGTILIKVWIDENGIPSKAEALSPCSRILADASVRAVLNARCYSPAVNRGKLVGCWMRIPVKFILSE